MATKKVEDKRAHILKVAEDVFFAKGYTESSLRDISLKGKISKAGIYHYFRAKEEILASLMLNHADGLLEAISQGIQSAEEKNLSPIEAIKTLGIEYAGYMLKNPKSSAVVLRDRHQLTGKEKRKLIEKERKIFTTLRNKLSEIPDLDSNKNTSLITFQFISGMHWLAYWFDPKRSLSKDEAINQGIHTFIHGITDITNHADDSKKQEHVHDIAAVLNLKLSPS